MPSWPGSGIRHPGGAAAWPDAQRGNALVEFLFLAVLLLIPVAYLVLTIGAVQGGAYAVVGAAEQAAKVYVLAEDEATATQAAHQAAALALRDMGMDPEQATVQISCAGACLSPGTLVTVRVSLRIALPVVTAVPGVDLAAATVDATGLQRVGRFK